MSLGVGAAQDRNELAGIRSLQIVCDDCGCGRRWTGDQISVAIGKGIRTVPDLGSRLFCRLCKERGASGKNVSIIPQLRRSRS